MGAVHVEAPYLGVGGGILFCPSFGAQTATVWIRRITVVDSYGNVRPLCCVCCFMMFMFFFCSYFSDNCRVIMSLLAVLTCALHFFKEDGCCDFLIRFFDKKCGQFLYFNKKLVS